MEEEEIQKKIDNIKLLDFLRDHYSPCYKVEDIKGAEYIMLNKDACSAVLRDLLGSNAAYNEFHSNGFGKEIIEELEENGYYPAHSLLNWEYVVKNNFASLNVLIDEFGEATLIEQYSPRFRYRVPKGDKSVGYFFSLMEKLKEKLDIDEYSASQTTLEQIFNGFARTEGNRVEERDFTQNITKTHNFTKDTLLNAGVAASDSRAVSFDLDQPNKPGASLNQVPNMKENSMKGTPSQDSRYEGGKDIKGYDEED